MKKLFNLLVIATMAMAIMFVACKKDDDDKGGGGTSGFVIEAKNVQWSSDNLETVEAKMSSKTYTTKYGNNAFKLSLPNDISGISQDRTQLELNGLNKNNNDIGIFICVGEKGDLGYHLGYTYATKDMTYTHEEEYEVGGNLVKRSYNCNLKKGWNIEYSELSENGNTSFVKTTTVKPDVVFIWYFLSSDLKSSGAGNISKEHYWLQSKKN
jgi:hypothetical protein